VLTVDTYLECVSVAVKLYLNYLYSRRLHPEP